MGNRNPLNVVPPASTHSASAPVSPRYHQRPTGPLGNLRATQQRQQQGQNPVSQLEQTGVDDLPPLPPGIDLEQLAQYGAAGLEMAIRMGMGIGMGLGQGQSGSGGRTPDVNSPLIQQQLVALLNEAVGSPSGTHTSSPFSASQGKGNAQSAGSGEGSKPGDIVADILGDDFFTARNPSTPGATPALSVGGASMPPTRRGSQAADLPLSPGVMSPPNLDFDEPPDELAKRDPLATQIWKAYAKARGQMPNGPRMENLTWRLMHMTLKKTDGVKPAASGSAMTPVAEEGEDGTQPVEETVNDLDRGREDRGRGRAAKGKAKVVGFDAESPQGQLDE